MSYAGLSRLAIAVSLILIALVSFSYTQDICDPINYPQANWRSDFCYPDTPTTCAYHSLQRVGSAAPTPCIQKCNFTNTECANRVFYNPTCGNNKCEVGEVGKCQSDCGFWSDRNLYNDSQVMIRCPGMMDLTAKPNGWRNRYFVLTFDDGPSNHTSKLLDILKTHNVSATFFMVGANVERNATQVLIKRMLTEGHLVASHTYSHFNMSEQPTANLLDDAASFDEAWENVLNAQFGDDMTYKYKVRFFRPPYGSILPDQIELMKEYQFENVMWNFDVEDYAKVDNGFKILDTTKQLIEENPGDPHVIYLGHDLTEPAVDAVVYVIEEFLKRNFTSLRLDECLYGVKSKSAYASTRTLIAAPIQKLFVLPGDDLLTGYAHSLVPSFVSWCLAILAVAVLL